MKGENRSCRNVTFLFVYFETFNSYRNFTTFEHLQLFCILCLKWLWNYIILILFENIFPITINQEYILIYNKIIWQDMKPSLSTYNLYNFILDIKMSRDENQYNIICPETRNYNNPLYCCCFFLFFFFFFWKLWFYYYKYLYYFSLICYVREGHIYCYIRACR